MGIPVMHTLQPQVPRHQYIYIYIYIAKRQHHERFYLVGSLVVAGRSHQLPQANYVSSYTQVYSEICDSGAVPEYSIFSPSGTSLPERQGQNLAFTVLCVPYSLESGLDCLMCAVFARRRNSSGVHSGTCRPSRKVP